LGVGHCDYLLREPQNLVRTLDMLLILLTSMQSRHKLLGRTLHVLSPPLQTCSVQEAQPASELQNGFCWQFCEVSQHFHRCNLWRCDRNAHDLQPVNHVLNEKATHKSFFSVCHCHWKLFWAFQAVFLVWCSTANTLFLHYKLAHFLKTQYNKHH